MNLPKLIIRLPDWVASLLALWPPCLPDHQDQMRLAIELSAKNAETGIDGPFGAAVFDDRGRLVSAGVNMVISGGSSILHAEMVAIALAQKKVGRFDLSGGGQRRYHLFSSTEPCAMCLGAIPWSGLSRLFCGARDEDARAIGFDEGAKPSDWATGLNQRGVQVERDLLRWKAVAVLNRYASSGGKIYNPVFPSE